MPDLFICDGPSIPRQYEKELKPSLKVAEFTRNLNLPLPIRWWREFLQTYTRSALKKFSPASGFFLQFLPIIVIVDS
jgi:hypothetical protein